MTDSPIAQRRPPGSMDDLVKAARTDRDAFGALFDQFYPSVFAYCVRRLPVRAVAEDVTSETFLKVIQAIGSSPITTLEDFRRWLFRIATNEINAQLRKSIRRRELLEQAARLGMIKSDVVHGLLETDAVIEWQEAYRELGELSEREQSIVSLRFFAGFTHEQIAALLQIKPGTIRVALNRALRKLRDRLRDSLDPEAHAPRSDKWK